MPTDSGKVHCTSPHLYEGQYPSSTMPIDMKNTMITVQPIAAHNPAHTQGERPTPTTKYTRNPGDV